MMDAYKKILQEKGEVYITVKVRPGAASTAVRGVLRSEDREIFKIDIAAAPERGKANSELISFLKQEFGQALKISIISGSADKLKLIKISK